MAYPEPLEALWRKETIPFEGFIPAFFFSCGFLRSAEAAREILRAALRRRPGDVAVSPDL